jgi:7-cyano-7-deazaguanine synthase in queuosine biosynthesis
MNKKEKVPVLNVTAFLFSGGIDSTAMLYSFIRDLCDRKTIEHHVIDLHFFQYAQSMLVEEYNAVQAIGNALEAYINIAHPDTHIRFRLQVHSIAMGDSNVNRVQGQDALTWAGKNQAYIPFRNAKFILEALSGYGDDLPEAIYLGGSGVDAKNAFPDCTDEFRKTMNLLLDIYGYDITVKMPLLAFTDKQNIIDSMPKYLCDLAFSGYGNSVAGANMEEEKKEGA